MRRVLLFTITALLCVSCVLVARQTMALDDVAFKNFAYQQVRAHTGDDTFTLDQVVMSAGANEESRPRSRFFNTFLGLR